MRMTGRTATTPSVSVSLDISYETIVSVTAIGEDKKRTSGLCNVTLAPANTPSCLYSVSTEKPTPRFFSDRYTLS